METSVRQSRAEEMLNNLELPAAVMIEWSRYWDTVRKEVGQINSLYRYFEGYVKNPLEAKKAVLEDFATSVSGTVSFRDSSLQKMMDTLHNKTMRNGDKALFTYLKSIIENNARMCSMQQSPHQLLYNLYNIIALTEIKGYAMIQFSYMMLKIYNKGNFTLESDVARQKFERQATEKMNVIKSVLPGMSRDYWRCDPTTHREGDTYLQITKLLQGYIENEVDMNERGTCKKECSAYTYAESRGCFKNLFCAKQKRCEGRIFDCQFFHADAWVCMSPGQERRYDWVEYEDGTILGNKQQCINKIKVDSWWRWVFWHCSYCLCKCDQVGPDSDRYWSLLPATANVDQNKVVTGVRFVKKNRVIHIQIEEAMALPEGGVDENSRTWVEPPAITDSDLTTNRHVFTMSYEQRALDTDSLSAPSGHVVTGLKLRNIGGHLNLELQVTPISFSNGQLVSDRSTWIANDNTPATNRPRHLVPIIMPDVPTRLIGSSEIDSEHDKYIQFDSTSAHKDVSQTTIPFIDSQPVAPSPATWLSGAGLYHKGRVGFGGFVGLRVDTFDFSRHLMPSGGDPTNAELKFDFVKAEDA